MGQESVLTFDAATHVYQVQGKRVPSVTQILSSLGFNEFGFCPPEVMEAARLRGNDVHKATELLDLNQLDWTTVSDEIAPYLIAYQKFLSEVKPKSIEVIEHKVYHKTFGYCGMCDRVYKYPYGLAMVDIKAGTEQVTHKLQTAAYAMAWDHEQGPLRKISRRFALYLFNNGKYKLVEHPHAIDRATFISAIQVFQWRQVNQ